MALDTVQLPILLFGLALIVGSIEAAHDNSNCLGEFCPILYLYYDSTGHQIKYSSAGTPLLASLGTIENPDQASLYKKLQCTRFKADKGSEGESRTI